MARQEKILPTVGAESSGAGWGKGRVLSIICGGLLLLILGLRLTISETLRESGGGSVGARQNEILPAGPGPEVTLGLAVATLLAVGIGVWGYGKLRRADWIGLGLMGVILVCAGISTCGAANRFNAAVGWADLAMVLVGGWGLGLLARDLVCRRVIVGLLLAVLCVWITKGALQYLVEFPDTVEYYQKNRAAILAQHHWEEGNPSIALFEARMRSTELTGFFYLSNVFAAGVAGVLVLAVGVLLVTWQGVRESLREWTKVAEPVSLKNRGIEYHLGRGKGARRGGGRGKREGGGGQEIPMLPMLLGLLLVLVMAGTVLLLATRSRGGMVLGLLAGVSLVGLYAARGWVGRQRKRLVLAGTLAVILLGLGGVSYGVMHQGLPSKSLLFRWQYWVGSVPMVQTHPWWGVGLNNFGDYYMAGKLPQAPEAVKDPHNFFVRYAAELGWPATLAVAGLILWLVYRALLVVPGGKGLGGKAIQQTGTHGAVLIVGSALVSGWWVLHVLIGETGELYSWMINGVYAGLMMGVFWLTVSVWNQTDAMAENEEGKGGGDGGEMGGGRECVVAGALLAGALAMLAYDQINMALVVGPVAMLFWAFLFMAQPESVMGNRPGERAGTREKIWGGVLLVAGISLGIWGWVPLMQHSSTRGLGAWDSRPWEVQASVAAQAGKMQQSLEALQQALARDPRSVSLRRWLILTKLNLHQPVAGDIEAMLELNRTDARLWLEMAFLNSDWPLVKRLEALKHIVWLDDQLPADEIMRLSPEDRARIAQALQDYRAQ